MIHQIDYGQFVKTNFQHRRIIVKSTKNRILALALAMLSLNASAESIAAQGTWTNSLQARDLSGDGHADAFYDMDLDITWLANPNAAAGSIYDDISPTNPSGTNSDGLMSLNSARLWTSNLNVYGVSGWRLPWATMLGWCEQGTPCGRQEMAHLVQVSLGNGPGKDFNSGPFAGIPPDGPSGWLPEGPWYWGEALPSQDWYAWHVNFKTSHRGGTGSVYGEELYVWAVHDGDVGSPVVSSVPEPSIPSGLLASILTLLALRKREIGKHFLRAPARIDT